MNFSLVQLVKAGGPVLLLLAALSVYSLALIWERWTTYSKNFSGLNALLKKSAALLKAGEIRQLAEICASSKTPTGEILYRVIMHKGSPLERREMAEKAVDWHVSKLHKGLTVLATIGSITPFVGLFGTVIGVIRAFRDLSVAAGAGPSVVAAGIAEALVNTAAGLFVAIPAVVAYNFFSNRLNDFSSEVNWAAEQIINRTSARETAT